MLVIKFGIPLSSLKVPLEGMHGQNLEGVGNVGFGQPCAPPGRFNKGDGVIHHGVIKREGRLGDETIDAGVGTGLRCG